ncbi:MAG: redox-regulated ATPase YchF [archaeon]|nr:MAG: redox-regulated ATPase YchF [archaeon]
MLIALVGKSNTGKSTFFKAATLVDVEISNRIFTTIKPNEGVAYITADCPCKELGKPCNPKNSKCENGTRLIPVKLLDVAGLVPGAHEGRGLGNQFLDDLRPAQVFIHILDISGTTDDDGNPAEGHDPEKDIKFFEEELDYWYTSIFRREWSQMAKQTEITHADFEKQILGRFSGLGMTKENIRDAIRNSNVDPTSPTKWTDDDVFSFAKNLRQSSKPIIIAANKMDLPSGGENFSRLKCDLMVPCCADFELALRIAAERGLVNYVPGSHDFEIVKELPEGQKKALEKISNFLDRYGSTGVQSCLNRAVFEFMNCIVVYPVEDETHWSDKKGSVLPDAHLVPRGTTARQLAYEIHSDIGDKFIGALDARTKRKIGADHELKSGDIIKILT